MLKLLVPALLLAGAAYAATGSELAAVERELAAADKTRSLIAARLEERDAELGLRVRALYKLTRAGHAPLFADEGARADLVRRRAAARRLLLRDLEERAALRDELALADAQSARLRSEASQLVAESPLPMAAGSLRPPVGGRRTQGYGPGRDPSTRARTFSRGVAWRTIDGAVVSAPAAGTLRYVGPLRGLGPSVLIELPEGISLLVAGLGRLDESLFPGQVVAQGARLGLAERGKITLELRRHGRTIDPAPLLAPNKE